MAIQIPKAIFLHIPKTGGTWITNYFKETGLDHNLESISLTHINGLKLREIIPYTEDLVFCFIRHPLTWYRSYWQMRQDLTDRSGGFLDTLVDQPFHNFIKDILKYNPGHLTERFKGYTERCRFIGKQEHLRTDLDNLLKYLNISYDRDYLFSRPYENKIISHQRYTKALAYEIMETEKALITQHNYNYIPFGIVE